MNNKPSSHSPVKIAVCGTGSMGSNHARILSSLPGVHLAGVLDADAKRAAEVAERYSCRVLDGNNPFAGVDGVVVAVPTCYHVETVAPLLKAGIGVLCEKPMAATPRECDVINEAAAETGAPLLVGHVEHFNPGVEAIASRIEKPGFMEVHRLGVFSPRSLDVDVVLDLMIHDIEIVLSLVASPLESVEAVGVSVLSDWVDIANARLTFADGCVANLTASRISREKVRKLRVFQSRAYLAVDYAEQAVEHYELRVGAEGRSIVKVPTAVQKEEPLRNELKHFADVLLRNATPRVDGKTARKAVAVANRILQCMKR